MASNIAIPASVLERLQARPGIKQDQPQKAAHQRSEHECPNAFCARFDDRAVSLRQQISGLCELADQQQRDQHLACLRADLESLQQDAAAAAYYLPQYDQRRTAQQCKDLEAALSTAAATAAPVKRFSFARRAPPAPPVVTATPGPSTTPTPSQPTGLEACLQHIPPSRVIRGLTGQTIVRTTEQLQGGELLLADLQGCTVFVLGTLDALWMYGLRDCRVYGGPVKGATFLDDAQRCCLMIYTGQLRLHRAAGCDAYLCTRSRPIVEHCAGIRVAPTCLAYPGLHEALQAAQLPVEAGEHDQDPPPVWSQVQDFDWIKATPSPHWSVLPPSQRMEPPLPPSGGCL